MAFLLAAVGAIGTVLLSDKAEYDKSKETETLFMVDRFDGLKTLKTLK